MNDEPFERLSDAGAPAFASPAWRMVTPPGLERVPSRNDDAADREGGAR